jgi:endogenous inhibitor of DNA gyrase (YacG/DUF329 family)
MTPKSNKCPRCGGSATKDGNKAFPFCSVRCQLVDLGRWLDEEYRIPAEPADPDEPELQDPEKREH